MANNRRFWYTGDTVPATSANRWENLARSDTYIVAPNNQDTRAKDGADTVLGTDVAWQRFDTQYSVEAADDAVKAPLKVMAGTIDLDREITIASTTGSGMVGEARQTVFKANPIWMSIATRMLESPGTSGTRRSYAVVRDITFDGNKGSVAYTTHGIVFDYNDYVLIENCVFVNNRGNGIQLNNCTKAIIRNCIFIGSTDWGIELYSCEDVVVEDCIFTSCYGGVLVDYSNDVTVSGCNISGSSSSGVYVQGTSTRPIIKGNTITSNGGHGIGLYYAGRNRTNAVIADNHCYLNSLRGIYVDGAEKCNIKGNYCYGNFQHGINALNSDGHTITGNNTELNSLRGLHLEGSSKNCVVVGNVSRNDGQVGISVVSGSHDAVVEANQVYYAGNQGILVDSSDRVCVKGNTVMHSWYSGIEYNNAPAPFCQGNTVHSSSRGLSNTYAHIILNGSSTGGQVANNICRNLSGYSNAKYGIQITSGSTQNYVVNNDVRWGWATAAIQNDGAATLAWPATNENLV